MVNCGATGSSHTDRPSEPRRVTRPGGSRSTQASITRSQACFEGAGPAVSRQLRHGWLEITDRPEHVGPGPRRTTSREPIDDLVDGDHLRCLVRTQSRDVDGGDEPAGSPVELGCFTGPPCPQIPTPLPVLWAWVSADASRHSAARSQVVGSRPFAATELADLDGQRVVDLIGALGEHLQQLPRQADDLGLAVDDRLPRHPVAVGQLGSQHRLVQAAQHPLVPLQVAGIQRQPPPVVGLDLGRDDPRGCAVAGRRRATSSDETSPPSSPTASGCWRRPSTRTRVVAPNHSTCASAAATATSWASSSPRSPVSAHHTLSDFGAENVASKPLTARTTLPLDNVRSRNTVPTVSPYRVSALEQRLADRPRRLVRRVRDWTPGGRCHTPGSSPGASAG